jgi:amino acid permease
VTHFLFQALDLLWLVIYFTIHMIVVIFAHCPRSHGYYGPQQIVNQKCVYVHKIQDVANSLVEIGFN